MFAKKAPAYFAAVVATVAVLALVPSGSARASIEGQASASEAAPSIEPVVVEFKDGAVFMFADRPAGVNDSFDALPISVQKLFLEKRKTILASIVRGLRYRQLATTPVVVIRNVVGKVIPSKRALRHPIQAFVEKLKRKNAEAVTAPKKSLREQGDDLIRVFANALDQQIWNRAPLISRSNEFGGALIVSAGAGAQFSKRGFYGSNAVGLIFGYNSDSKALVIRVVDDLERVTQALPVVAQVAATGKLLVYVANRNSEQTQAFEHGSALYPPGPFITIDTPDTFMMGLSQGIGFPPLDTFYAFKTKLLRASLVDVFVSPILPGYVRVKVGAMGAVKASVESVKALNARLRDRFGGPRCESVFES